MQVKWGSGPSNCPPLSHSPSSSRIAGTDIKILDLVQYSEVGFFSSHVYFNLRQKSSQGSPPPRGSLAAPASLWNCILKCKKSNYIEKNKTRPLQCNLVLATVGKQTNKQIHSATTCSPARSSITYPDMRHLPPASCPHQQIPMDLHTSHDHLQNLPVPSLPQQTKLHFLPSALPGVTTTRSSKIGFSLENCSDSKQRSTILLSQPTDL